MERLWLYCVAILSCLHSVSPDINCEIRDFISSKDLLGVSACSERALQENGVLELGPVLQEPMSSAKKSKLLSLVGNDTLFRFKLNPKPLSCSNKKPLIFEVPTVPDGEYSQIVAIAEEYNNSDISVLIRSLSLPFYFTFYGYFKTHDDFYSREQYCIEGYDETTLQVKVCPAYCAVDICIPKHCSMSFVIGTSLGDKINAGAQCVEASGLDVWTPSVDKENGNVTGDSVYYTRRSDDFAECQGGTQVRTSHANAKGRYRGQLKVGKAGISFRSSGNEPWQKPDVVTVDGIVDLASGSPVFSNQPGNEAVIICDKSYPEVIEEYGYYSKIFLVLYSLAVAVMAIIVIIYVILWEKLGIQGWVKTLLSSVLLLNHLMVVVDYAGTLYEYEGIQNGSNGCIIVGVLNHYFGTAVYSWLAILCFDLWRSITSLVPPSGRGTGTTKFFVYVIVAFGIPLVTVGISVFIELHFDMFDDRVVRPLYGQLRCDVDKSASLYHGVPTRLLLFIASTTFGILSGKFLYISSKHELRKSTANLNQFQLLVKLFILMSPTLIFEIIPSDAVTSGKSTPWVWLVFYFLNALIPYGLFWIFVCNREIKQKLVQKFPCLYAPSQWLTGSTQSTT